MRKLKFVLLVKEANLERPHTVGFNYVTFWKRQIMGAKRKTGWLPGVRDRGEINMGSTGDFRAVKLVCMILQ